MVARVDPFVRAVLAASLAHGALIVSVLSSLPPEDGISSSEGGQRRASELIEIDILLAEEVVRDSGAAEAPAHQLASPSTRSRPMLARRSTVAWPPEARFAEAQCTAEPDDSEAARSSSASEAPVERSSLSLGQLGLEGPNRLALRALPSEPSEVTQRSASDDVPSADRVIQSMRQLAWEHDRKIGLGSGGPVATALEKAAYEMNATLEGQATFEVVVLGNVVSAISVVASGSEQKSVWTEVAKTALTKLAGRHVRAPRGSRGVVLRIQVASRIALPSGHDPGVEISVGPFVVQRGHGKRSARLAFLVPDPGLTSAIDVRGKSGGLPAAAGGVSLVRTDVDPVDLNASARRVVHASTLDERLLD